MRSETDQLYSQLAFDFTVRYSAPAAIVIPIKDVDRVPRVLVAKRMSGGGKGTYSFPGGSLMPGESPVRGALRETYEETGWRILDGVEGLVSSGDPREISIYGNTLLLHVFFAFADEETKGKPVRREPDKLGPWQWKTLAQIATLTMQGLMHIAILENEWVNALNEARYLALLPQEDEFDELAFYREQARMNAIPAWGLIPRELRAFI